MAFAPIDTNHPTEICNKRSLLPLPQNQPTLDDVVAIAPFQLSVISYQLSVP
ncbi:MAG: hypothetical protein F6K17_34680 [Okeania sp. SIO3C4]|nr:hypothetical protein [Okeania sp. SIO3B3]NER07349.1 hypothetical protein [Okeania sp. SIO3C4]